MGRGGIAKELRRKCQLYGVKYEPGALLWDREIRSIANAPTCCYIDWMHTFAASGGVAQCVVNSMALQLEASDEIDVSLADIDEWVGGAKVKYSKSDCK